MADHGKILLQWGFSEFEVHERGTAWYFWMTLLGGAFVLGAIFAGNFLFAFIVLLVALLLVFYERRGPRTLRCQITDQGVEVGASFFPYTEVKDFRIVYDPPTVKHLYLTFQSALKPRVTVGLVNENPLAVRKVLQRYAVEDLESEGEPWTDTFIRRLKL